MPTQPKDHLANEHTCFPGFPAAPPPLVVSSLKLQKFACAGVESLLELLRVHERANYLGNRAENVGKLEFFIARLFIVKPIRDYMCACILLQIFRYRINLFAAMNMDVD